MKNTTKWISTTAAVLALSSTLAFAAPHQGGAEGGRQGRHGKHGFNAERLAQKLNLTEAQKAQLKAQAETFRAQNKAFFESNRETFQQYREAKKANDTAKMQSLQSQVDAAREQMKSLRQTERQQFLSVLTPDQRAQLDAMQAERKAKRNKQQ
jgi:protein CpxP